MPPVAAIAPIGLPAPLLASPQPAAPVAGKGSFGAMVMAGLARVDAKVTQADALVQAFAVGESIPVHQVTLALEQARLSVELAVQVRTRLVETYRDFMNMQV